MENKPTKWSLRCRISSSLDSLNELHENFPFISDEYQIRPSDATLKRKESAMRDIEDNWESAQDYIISTIFFKPSSVDPFSNKLVADIKSIDGLIKFEKNEFPYQLQKGWHYVLWFGPSPNGVPSEEDINTHITRSLEELTNRDDFDFAWYENPKMSFPSVYHVQVFWHVPCP